MSDIESRAIPFLTPMILGEHVTLSPEGQEAVATWMSLRALMIRAIGPKRPSVARDWLDSLLLEHACPPQWITFLGAYDGRVPVYFDGHSVDDLSMEAASIAATDGKRNDGIIATIIVGYLAVKLVGLRGGSLPYPDQYMSPIGVGAGDCHWPPNRIATDETIADFCGTFLSQPSSISEFLPPR